MTFSIVIPTFNGSAYIESTIKSALSQTRKADEIVVCDDNSTDSTINLCQKYSDFIKIFKHQEGPSGFVNGWNNAITHATSDYVTVLHQDDLLSPFYLECIENVVKNNSQVKHFFTGYKVVQNNFTLNEAQISSTIEISLYRGKDYSKKYINGIFTGNHLHRCPGVTTERNLLLTQCTYRKEAGHIADDDFFIRVGNYTDVIGIHEVLAYYREHPFSTTNLQENLPLVLAKDWIFQMNEFYQKKNILLDSEDGDRLTIFAVRDLTTSLLNAIVKRDQQQLNEIFGLEIKIHSLTGKYPRQISKTKNKKLFWTLTDNNMLSLARALARLLTQGKKSLRIDA